MKFISLIVSLLFVQNAYSQNSVKKTIDLSSQESKVEFFAVGKPSLIKINGTGGKLKGQLNLEGQQVSGLIQVPMQDLTTGIALRDEHMKDKYLEVSKHPEATLQINELKMDKDYLKEEGAQKNVPFKGVLKIHGVEKPIEGTADLNSSGNFLQVLAKMKTNITDHKIDIPSYLGVKVADEVSIQSEIKIKKQ